MLTLEVDGQFVTWPEQFAFYMMRYYQSHDVTFTVHRNCIHAGWNTTAEKYFAGGKVKRVGTFEYACG